ncbi:DUF72 domain-containing protein [Negadavirga shengliensis]|uniref:DUF72 domain-containing protein n=1 Tax=Negadavirga shengliensis TaxID=1389218 RepID=A0ABV9T813_9BACT
MGTKNKTHIGTSGWHYKHWIGTFYPEDTKEKDQLAYYVKHFNTVEINNPFYRIPSPKTFEKWKESVPADFLFSVKGNRHFTHLKKLNADQKVMDRFFSNVDKLGKKTGPVLFQLPPGWNINTGRLQSFLKRLPSGHRYTFEFRNETWYDEEVYEVLTKYNCAFCIYELGGHHSPLQVTADFVYIRLHGPGGKYQGSYSEAKLKEWADRCREWQKESKEVYVYFDNDQSGYAAFNAKDLKEMVEK